MTEFFDSPGPMAKSASDLVNLAQIMLGRAFSPSPSSGWNGLTVGFVDPRIWKMDESMCSQFEGTADQMVRRLPPYHNAYLD